MKSIVVYLDNRRAYFGKDAPFQQLKAEMQFRPKGYEWMPRYAAGGWDGYLRLLRKDKDADRYYCGAGLFLALRERLEKKLNAKFEVHDDRKMPRLKMGVAASDRDYQNECVKKMTEASRTGGLVLAATAAGKTRIAGTYMSRIVGNCVFIVDELQLLEQAREEISKVMGEKVGKIGESEFLPERVTVATVQTLEAHLKDPKFQPWAKSISVSFLDEIHLALNKRSIAVINHFYPQAVFGLTATLELEKKAVRLQAFDLCGPVVFQYKLTTGVEEGFLSKGVVVCVEFSNEKLTSGYLHHTEEYERMISENKARNNRAEYLTRVAVKRGHSVIIMVHRRNHVKALSHRFYDLPHACVYGPRKTHERRKDTKNFDEGKIPLIIASQVFKKGIDIKKVDVIIDLAGGRDANDAQQKYGRGVRLCDAKEGLIYIDLCDQQKRRQDTVGMRIKNRFATAAKARIRAFKKLGVSIFGAPVTWKAEEIILRAEKALSKEGGPKQGHLFGEKAQ